MAKDRHDPARQARILNRRAARTRRSKWLGRLLFSLTGMGLLLALRLNPGIVEEVVAMAHDVPKRSQPANFEPPEPVHVRNMPRDMVPVRRAGTLPQTQTASDDTQQQADAIANALRGLNPGG
ncbi:hypothetical protein [uncultured Tateyamaria sp.]|uniref:hypothetical protein n=1 Tax=uncultured Tateyamaria sp. TaxID=455651 RepID=UPI00260F73EA|nr:hypothetical protein [uncultured Tateyamaria sp.]